MKRLVGLSMPSVALQQFSGESSDPSTLRAGWVGYYIYPGTATEPPAPGDGPTADAAQHRAYGRHKHILAANGVTIIGLSAQSQHELFATINANRIDHLMLSDPQLALGAALELPTFQHDGRSWYRRVTLLTCDGEIRWVFHPIDDPPANPRQIRTWLQLNR